MKRLNKFPYIGSFIVVMSLLVSCIKSASFESNELKFSKPFLEKDTVEFISLLGQRDTIIFHKAIIDTLKIRNIGQGFYNEIVLRIGYELTDKSYHKMTVKSINEEPSCLISFSKVYNSHSSKEVCFLGLLVNEDYINKVLENSDKDKTVLFTIKDAKYKDVNINEGINNFVFNFDQGIVSFTDKNDIKWVRRNLR